MVPVYGESEFLVRCIKSILKFTPIEIPILICDDASPGRSTKDFLRVKGIPVDKIKFIRREVNLGFLGNCNLFFSEATNTNVILVNSDVIVSVGWFDALIDPIEKYSNVATVTAMTNSGSIATVKLGLEELPELDEKELESLNSGIHSSPQPKNAEIPVGVGHCMLITAQALGILGCFDDIFAPGYGEEADFSVRAGHYGMQHYLANTVVTHFGSKTFGEKSNILKISHDKLLNQKHPGYLEYVQNFNLEDSQVESMFLNVLTKYRGLRILFDARLMSTEGTGTSRLILQSLIALSLLEGIKITVLLQESSVDFWKSQFSSKIELTTKPAIVDKGYTFDVVYGPSQVSNGDTISEYKFWGRRVAILQLDFIAYDNWKYFASVKSHSFYRNAIERTYDEVDAILYISKYIQTKADRIFDRKCQNDQVIYCGVDHFAEVSKIAFEPNRILVIGAGFAHKNQMYAVKLFDLLRVRMPNVKLVFVGPKPTFGYDEEFWTIISNLPSDASIEYHSWLSDDQLKEEISKSQIVLYPTTSEGFGFIPFEAVKLERASIFNLNSSLSEFFQGIPHKLVFSPNKDAETIFEILTNKEEYKRQLNFIRQSGTNFTWEQVAITLHTVLQNTILSRRLTRVVKPNPEIEFEEKFNFLTFVGSQRLVLILFPHFSNRRNKLIAFVKKRIL
jgi:GT2 family glycosyltransferase/glycosyltransferase involved in cell wall biosynthesis